MQYVHLVLKAYFRDDMTTSQLFGKSASGVASSSLPLGNKNDAYRLFVYAQITDNDGGVTNFYLNQTVVVQQDAGKVDELITMIQDVQPGAVLNLDSIFQGSPQAVASVMGAIASIFNDDMATDAAIAASIRKLSYDIMIYSLLNFNSE